MWYPCNYRGGGGISNSQIVTEEGKYSLDAVQNNPTVEGSLRNELERNSGEINTIKSRGQLLSHLVGTDATSFTFTVTFARTEGYTAYRVPIIIYVASQSGFQTTIYGVIQNPSLITFTNQDGVTITTTSIGNDKIKVTVVIDGVHMWGNAMILTWGEEIKII